jgi:hypothetical protein
VIELSFLNVIAFLVLLGLENWFIARVVWHFAGLFAALYVREKEIEWKEKHKVTT